jgi:hypothetical protein
VPLAKLSERFYQKFGHDLVEELVTWLNEMDSGSRTDLRELNELNFARFDAKLEQRIAEVKSDLRTELAQVRSELHKEVEHLRVELRAGLAEVRSEFRDDLVAQSRLLVKWMLGIWLATVPALASVIVVVQHFLPAAR